MHRYSQEEIDFIKSYAPGRSYKETQEAFKKEFGWELRYEQLKGVIARHKIITGRDGRFKKRCVPYNKGEKMSDEIYSKCYPTMFKEGHKPHNTDPIGTEKMLADGYIWVKIDDKPKVKKQVNWKQKHKLIWEEANGPLPEGYVLTFLDGDHTNCELSNLAMIKRGENATMNRMRLYSSNKELTKTGIAIAKLVNAKNQKKSRSER